MATLDLDQLRTLTAIVDTGSFTRAAEKVHKTQSAVSMQMRRLEEKLGRDIFTKDGRQSKLTEDGERLLHHARRMLKLNDETLAMFDESEVSGVVRIGTPDDYADRFLPMIMARFSRSYPGAEVSVTCAPTPDLRAALANDELDIAIVTHVLKFRQETDEIIRREPLLWTASEQHCVESETPLPLALGRPSCDWRQAALAALDKQSRNFRILYTSWNSTAVSAAVLSGLAVSVLPESAIRPGMRILGEAEGFPDLPSCEIALIRNPNASANVTNALAEHIKSSLNNLSVTRIAAE
ncbi:MULTISPECIES: LysR substrate-binding domain-containing protein [Pseudovibrio]|uniref:LysR substrate-binding domain-containing protein n=1 Tax=Stappiaceae TaxID=2821832 RepID=UPI0023668FEE|nr:MULTISPECIES: LysR substrate-binding domain-containing protein [Pseudovibrio]MDD7911388.1 LysR substrate-binding domain-containing protein [Pseudovibrio exalbescens]MDX5592925.1 LysR substrate-binding domain-containing protein [Pseudovibrio sp. SPO723]